MKLTDTIMQWLSQHHLKVVDSTVIRPDIGVSSICTSKKKQVDHVVTLSLGTLK